MTDVRHDGRFKVHVAAVFLDHLIDDLLDLTDSRDTSAATARL